MLDFDAKQFDCEGPLGLPMKDEQAQALDQILKDLPKDDPYAYRQVDVARQPNEVDKEERTDVSWISTEDKDFAKDIVLSRGMDDSIYNKNPIVVWNHDYAKPAVARSLWRKPKKSGETRGVIAKTHYPPKPASWEGPWMSDQALDLVFLRLLPGKSVGFLPIKARRPTPEEIKENPKLYGDVRFIVEKWLLLEYSLQVMPCNHNALVEACQKGELQLSDVVLKDLGVTLEMLKPPEEPPEEAPSEKTIELPDFQFVTKTEYLRSLQRSVDQFNYAQHTERQVENAVKRFLGRV